MLVFLTEILFDAWFCFIDHVLSLHFKDIFIYRFENIIPCNLFVVLRKPFAIIFDLYYICRFTSLRPSQTSEDCLLFRYWNFWRIFFCSFEDITSLSDSTSLSEISLDGNPITQEQYYKQIVLRHMQQLKQLDMKRVTVSRSKVTQQVVQEFSPFY